MKEKSFSLSIAAMQVGILPCVIIIMARKQQINGTWQEEGITKESTTEEINRVVKEIREFMQEYHEWMKERGYATPPRSACLGCPFRSNKEWQELKESNPADFTRAADFDQELRTDNPGEYVHRSLQPLVELDLNEQMKIDPNQQNLFNIECEGMRGV